MNLPATLQAWAEARSRHRLSDAVVQMARELGLNPRKLGKIDNHHQETWKRPLPEFIAHLYFKRFGRKQPENVMSLEQRARFRKEKKAAQKAKRQPKSIVVPTP